MTPAPALVLDDRRHLAEALVRQDFLRGSPWASGGPGLHKEWLHFCVLTDDLHLLVNWSLSDDPSAGVARGTRLPRITVLACERGAWDGDVDTFDPAETRAVPGRLELAYGENICRFADGTYRVRVALRERPVSVDMELLPLTAPLQAPSIPQLDGPPLRWVTMPRLAATGTARVGGRTYSFARAAAYHDHNWGHFPWGADFAWRWGFALPYDARQPWSVVFACVTDRHRHYARGQGMWAWRHHDVARGFRAESITVRTDRHYLPSSHTLKGPRVMGLVWPEAFADVPRWLEATAESDGDRVRCRFEAEHLAQVVVPAEEHLGVTVINEVIGRSTVDGTIRGESFTMDCRSVFEFLVA
jgi:hypothetical protein